MRIKHVALTTICAAGIAVAGLAGSSSAASACTADEFTTDGTFDQDGYLACLAAESNLPPTGQNSLDTVGIAAGLAVLGGGLLVASRRHAANA